MADFQQTASQKAVLNQSGGDIFTSEAFKLALTQGLDKVFKREFEMPKQGMQFVREETMDRETATYQSYRSIGGSTPLSRDADDIPMAMAGDGFGFTVNAYTYRQGISIERTLVEVDNVGVIRGRQADLTQNAMRSIEWAIADVFNRGVNPSAAPVLADDGMYLIDTARPSANPQAGTWSNQESNSLITPSSIFQAQLNARATTDENGDLAPQRIRAVICRPQDGKTLWEIRNSDYRPTDAMQVNNYFKEYKPASFDIFEYDWLTSASIFYLMADPKSMDNELMFMWRVRPSLTTYDGSNPDVMHQRIRMAFGIGLGSPRKMWRGGVVGA